MFKLVSSMSARPALHRHGGALRRSGLAAALVVCSLTGSAAAQLQGAGEPPQLRQPQKIRTAPLGVTRPGGIAYLPGSDLFAILPARPIPGSPSITLLTRRREPAGMVNLPFEIADARAVAFDARQGRLLALDPASRTLYAVGTNAEGMIDASRTSRLQAPRQGLIRPAGMAVDAVTGDVFVLDRLSRRIMRFAPDSEGRVPEARWISLGQIEAADLAALAFDSRERRFFVLDLRARRVHELAEDGRSIGAFAASEVLLRRPAAMVLAPSGDGTDDPAIQHLFCADPGASAIDRGLIVELGWPLDPAVVEAARLAAPSAVTATLVRTIATSAWSPKSPDPSGIGYDPNSGRLIVVDGEVEEMSIWANRNAWECSLSGVVQRSANLTNFTDEPVGVAINPNNRRVFVSDDDTRRVYEVNVGSDQLFGTSDDSRTSFSTTSFGCDDPEGVAFDPSGNRLFIASGLDQEIWILRAGTNGVINGGGDDVITHFDTASRGISDPETVEYKSDTGTLLIIGKSPKVVFELTTTGSVVNSTDVSFAPLRSPAGLAYAPSSGNSSQRSWYIVNRGTDNDSDPRENDGTLLEIATGQSGGGTPPPSSGPDFRVATSSDDAEESSSGSVALTSGDLELVYDGNNQTVGLRFANIGIARNATISTAWLQFEADETHSETTSLTIRGQAADNAATFTSSSGNVSSRSRTSASVGWSVPAWNNVGDAGSAQRSPELRTLIQEIVNRSGWSSGNALALIITGTGRRAAVSYDGSANAAPVLHIETGSAPPTNTAPTVNAGSNQTITLPASASLNGTVNDDGLPSPPSLTTTWSKVSGPGSVTFGNANAVDTQASFSASGSYVLQLTADDGQLSASDQVTVTVNPPSSSNTAPTVNAGPDQTITLPASASLDGTVSDDGLPSPPSLTTTWSKVSGPGSVTFGNANAVDTQASFSTSGSYVLRLTASDGSLSNNDQLTVNVNPEPPGGGNSFEKRIAASSDDAEEAGDTQVVTLTSSDIELVKDGTDQTVGMRFSGVTVPRNATITNAYIQFTTDEVRTGAISLQVRGQAAGTPPTFTTATGDISLRPRTNASVAWAPPDWNVIGEAGAAQRTPNLSSVIQEIVNRSDWNSGQALVIIVTGTGRRNADCYDGIATQGPLLHIDYQ